MTSGKTQTETGRLLIDRQDKQADRQRDKQEGKQGRAQVRQKVLNLLFSVVCKRDECLLSFCSHQPDEVRLRRK